MGATAPGSIPTLNKMEWARPPVLLSVVCNLLDAWTAQSPVLQFLVTPVKLILTLLLLSTFAPGPSVSNIALKALAFRVPRRPLT